MDAKLLEVCYDYGTEEIVDVWDSRDLWIQVSLGLEMRISDSTVQEFLRESEIVSLIGFLSLLDA